MPYILKEHGFFISVEKLAAACFNIFMSVVVITPTYNERSNLPELAEKIFALGIPSVKMVVVDDNSPDGTGEVARMLAQKYPVEVICREKKIGLGPAYIEAFRQVLKRENPEIIIQMDADHSHDPRIIPQMLESIKGCDVVIGSRYIPGGMIENWELSRRLLSRWGNFYARIMTGLPYGDLTSGFKCWRRSALENINFDSLSSVGYNFQIETTYQAHKNRCRIKEIPIVFTERKSGMSKMDLGIVLESFWKVFLLRFH